MNTKTPLTRRRFIGYSLGMVAAASPIGLQSVLAEEAVLPFRKDASILKLHFNENSLGMSPKALLAAQEATQMRGNRYPDVSVNNLRVLLAEEHKVAPEQILFGNGSVEVLSGVVRLAAKRGAVVVEPTPTFGMVRTYAKAEGLTVHQVPVTSEFETDIDAMRKEAGRHKGPVLINLCNPNNPTGTVADYKYIWDWIEQAPDNHLFLLDEAYHDYALQNSRYKSGLEFIHKGRENLVIARTFSKIHGMAGMRVGYGVAAKETAKQLTPFTADFNLTAAGAAAAIAALQDDAFYQQSLASNQKAKAILLSALDELELKHIDSNTNFVLHRINADLETYSRRMKDNGIWVGRRMTKDDGWNRLSIGTPQEMQQFSTALKEFRKRGWV